MAASSSTSSQLVYGLDASFVSDIKVALNAAAQDRCLEFIAVPMFHPRLQRSADGNSNSRPGPITRSDFVLSSGDWSSNIVGTVSSWIDLDNEDAKVRASSETAFDQEVRWAAHLGLQAILIPPPRRMAFANYCKCLNHLIDLSRYQHTWIQLPLSLSIEYGAQHSDSWHLWNGIRTLMSYNPKLSVALVLNDVAEIDDEALAGLDRWVAEPVKAIIVGTRLFSINSKGFPVLSPKYQKIIKTLINKSSKTHIIIRGKPRHNGGYKDYMSYFEYLRSQVQSVSEAEKFTIAYRDTLQIPLQPLMDNLECNTYEVFEQDPTKYSNYEKAINLALVDMWFKGNTSDNPISAPNVDDSMAVSDSNINSNSNCNSNCSSSSNNSSSNNSSKGSNSNNSSSNLRGSASHIVIMVVGAGRGPLVAAALAAAAAASVPVKIYAVEKNPNAVITLRNRLIRDNWTNVTIIEKDMRMFRPEEAADILVSELLGSWGDNELSPECLDGAQVYLKPGGISIPKNSTSFAAPVSTSKLWVAARDMPGMNGLHTPFVVKFNDFYLLDRAKPLFCFEHPNYGASSNARYTSLTFESSVDTLLHGFMGSFESVLYKDVMLSINPRTHTPGMFSWFPLFIPLETPITVKAGDSIVFNCWRCVDSRKVWYEWCLTSPVVTGIQNKMGKSYWIGL